MTEARYGQRSYDAFLAPMELAWFGRWRKKMLSGLSGEVLDIGSGTGTNLKYYPGKVDRVTVLDPNEMNISYIEKRAGGWGYGEDRCLRSKVGYGEDIPFPSNAFDNVVSTLILCTVKEPERVISEGVRVLRRGGRFVFIEHQLPRKRPQAVLFDMAAPAWKAPSGCNLNRETEKMIRSRPELVEIESFRGGPLLGYPFFIGSFERK